MLSGPLTIGRTSEPLFGFEAQAALLSTAERSPHISEELGIFHATCPDDNLLSQHQRNQHVEEREEPRERRKATFVK